ncbi:MAG: UbiA family prenyltransferase [Flavobacteriia bacterium]|nr:UbiA family prenyltransferase [Flavobacteriia bacterium]
MVASWWKLIRGSNVLFVIAIPLILYFGFLDVYRDFVSGIAEVNGIESSYVLAIDKIQVVILAFSLGFIAAAGYIINDVYDQQADEINKPKRRTVGVKISEKMAMRAFYTLAILGLASGAYVSYVIDHLNYIYLHGLSLAILWLYAIDFKARYLIGNLLIALLAGLNVWAVGMFALLPTALRLNEYDIAVPVVDHPISQHFILISVLAGFAFISTLLRELVKDMQDIEGDKRVGYKTVATRSTRTVAKVIIAVVTTLEILGLTWVLAQWSDDKIALFYIVAFLVIPLLAFLIYLPKVEKKEQWGLISNGMKIQMFMGLLTPVILLLLEL